MYTIGMDDEKFRHLTVIQLRDDPKLKMSTAWPFRLLLATNAVTSIIGLVITFILLALPISMLVIGVRYERRYHCPIEPRISLFLIVFGGVGLGYLVLTFLLSLIVMFTNYSKLKAIFSIVVTLTLLALLIQLFLIAWAIVGCVWTFSIYNIVQYTNRRRWRTYCNGTLYVFSFAYLIVLLVVWFIQLVIRVMLAIFYSRNEA